MIERDTVKQRFRALTSELKALTPKEMSALTGAVRAFLADPIPPAQAEEEIKRKLETRAQCFLELARAQIYEQPASPYLKLLRAAGCEHAYLEREVLTRGVEQALEQLARAGVYLTSAEFKGKNRCLKSDRCSPFGQILRCQNE